MNVQYFCCAIVVHVDSVLNNLVMSDSESYIK